MKLIRLATDDRKANFDNDFSSDIDIMKNSLIALHSVSFEPITNVLTVDAGNDNITYNLTNTTPGNAKTINLAHAEYTNINFQDFLDDITKKINDSFEYVAGKQIGSQFKAFIDTQTKKAHLFFNNIKAQTNLGFEIRKNTSLTSNFCRKNTNLNVANDATVLSTNQVLTGGCGAFRVRLKKSQPNGGAANTSGLTVFLTETPPDQFPTTIPKAFSIRCVDESTNYSFFDGTNNTDAGFQPENASTASLANNDVLEFVVTEGNLEGRIYRLSQAGHDTLFTVPLDTTKSYFPCVSFQGGNLSTEINDLRLHYDKFKFDENNVVETGEDGDVEHGVGARPPDLRGNTRTIYSLTLPESVAEFLGYKFLTSIIGGKTAEYIADKAFQATLKSDAYIVEMKNIELQSYDGFNKNGMRKNILSIIPKNKSDGVVEYEPNTPYFIHMNNMIKSLRNVKARILRSDLEPIEIAGVATMTILIKCPDE